ncbi:hypothetical protein HKX48_004592 [Thoreauomyces humboldtii]|nr:hypothetical protein HKX48_004592 [Thoreauomyces humboldtii]
MFDPQETSGVSEHPFLVSFIPINVQAGQNRRIVNIESSVLIGRLLDKDEPSLTNLKFASKVVSRQHALMAFQDGKLYVQDTKSSSGTFLNSKRLSPQGMESTRVQVHNGDVLRLGEDCEVNGVIHQSVVLRVAFGTKAGIRERLGSHDSSLDLARFENSENDQYMYGLLLDDHRAKLEKC